MRDIPMFTTENGVASLIFKKIPYTKEAFVHIRDSMSCDELLQECIDVCRMAGAEKIFATGHNALENRELFCSILRYVISTDRVPSTDGVALPVSMEQKDWWRQLYNEKMAGVPSAAPLSDSELTELIQSHKAFCVYRECSLVGIGVAYDGQIHAVASVVPGGGKCVVSALTAVLDSPVISLSVASLNHKAVSLYKSLGFEESAVEAKWYKIF